MVFIDFQANALKNGELKKQKSIEVQVFFARMSKSYEENLFSFTFINDKHSLWMWFKRYL